MLVERVLCYVYVRIFFFDVCLLMCVLFSIDYKYVVVVVVGIRWKIDFLLFVDIRL